MGNAVPKSIKASLYIDGKPAESSIKSVEQATRQLERELKSLIIGTDAWNAKMKQVAENKKYLKEIRDEINGVSGAFGQLKQELGKIGTLAAGYLGFQFITTQFQGIIAGNAKLSDSLADVRRVTGLTEAGVLDLDRSLGKLDTRTSKGGLRDIAIVAGKLGVAKSEILSFVAATDKLTVALGDELGDANALTTQLGKILNVFEGSVNGDNISRLGNAMVGLANDGVASGAFIAQYTQLISGIAKTAGVSLPATLALGAGLEELGGRAESSATATQKLLISITQNKDAYKIAGVSLASFNKMLADAPEKALLLYAKGLTANKNAFAEVTAGLKDAGEEGARTIELITKLGQNTEFFNDKIEKTGKLYQETGQITDAYNLKNQTLGAQVDKLGKDFNALASNTTLVNFLTNLVHWASSSVAWLKENSVTIGQLIKVVIVGATAWLGYKSALVLTSTWTAITSGYMAAQRVIGLLLALAQATLTGNTLRAAAAQRALGLAMTSTPLGAVLAVISALAAAYVLFNEKITTAAKIQQDFNNINAAAQSSVIEEKNNIQNITKALNDENVPRGQKLILVQKLRDMMPEYLKQYSDEEILAGKAISAINKYVAALERKSLAEAAQSQIKKLQEEKIALQTGSLDDNVNGFDIVKAAVVDKFVPGKGSSNLVSTAVANRNASIAEKDARIKEIQAKYGGIMFEQLVTPETGTGGGGTAGKGLTKKEENEAEKARKKALSEFEKLGEEYKKLNLQRLNDQLSSNQKELKQEADKYDALIAKEKEFLALKGATPDQKKKTEQNIIQLDADKQKAVNDLAVRQEAEMTKQIAELRTRLTDLHETELQKQTDQINKFYDDLESKSAGNENAIARLRIERTTELANAELREKERLEKEKEELEAKYDTLVGTKPAQRIAKINKKYDDEVAALKSKYSKELQLSKEFQDALALIEKNRVAEVKLENKTAESDKKLFALEMTQQTADAAFTILSNNRNAETNRVIKSLDDKRAAELDNDSLTADQKKEINNRYDAQIKEEKLKAWKADRDAALAQIVVNGAIAVSKAFAQTGVLAPFVIPTIVAGTLLQSAIVLAQPAPEYAEGGFSNNDPSGYVSKATLFKNSASGRNFVAGEEGREWIAPNWMVKSPRFANIIGLLESARQEKRAFASGGFNGSAGISTTNKPEPTNYNFDYLVPMLSEFIIEQRRINQIPVVLSYAKKEKYERDLDLDRQQQIA